MRCNLQFIKIFPDKDIDFILSFFKDNIDDFGLYDICLKNIIESNIDRIVPENVIKKINILLLDDVFSFIKKDTYILPTIKNIPIEVLRDFLNKVLYDYIIQSFLEFKQNEKFFKEGLNIIKSDHLVFMKKIYNMTNLLKDNINNIFYKFFINFYIYILNKYDSKHNYILPIINSDNQLLLSIAEDKNFNYGGNITEEKENIVNNLKEKLMEMGKEPFIKSYYDVDFLKRIEHAFDNNKLNNLIKNKQIKLSSDFQENIKELDKTTNEDDARKYFEKLFIIDKDTTNNESEEVVDKLFKIYSNETNKELFFNYLVDTLSYHMNLHNKDNNKNKKEMISIVDNVFEKILNSNFDKNSLNLENDDMKFILLLEVLDTLKLAYSSPTNNTSSLIPNSKIPSNVIVNVYRDGFKKTKINDNEITFN